MRHAHIFYMENFANRIEGLSRGTVLDDVVLGIFHTLRKKLERKKLERCRKYEHGERCLQLHLACKMQACHGMEQYVVARTMW